MLLLLSKSISVSTPFVLMSVLFSEAVERLINDGPIFSTTSLVSYIWVGETGP